MTAGQSRREFLKRACALSIAGGAAPFALNLASIGAASAQSAGSYRALVCLFMFGGNDHTNTIIPYDPVEHAAYVNARQSISIARDALAATSIAPVASQGGRPFAFHPALTTVKTLYDAGKVAVVANVGPLIVPTTRAQFRSGSVPLPPKLFSHNDQQSGWQATTPVGEGARLGWGGRIGDLLASQNGLTVFTCISASGNAVFLSGRDVLQYQLSSSGAVTISAISGSLFGSQSAASAAYRRILTRTSPHLFEDELGKITTRSINANALLNSALPPASQFTPAAPANNALAAQLNVVARMIFARSAISANRQVFFVSLGGFDNHDELLGEHNQRMQTVDAAVGAFYGWLQQMQMENSVTLFTASDFGRTLTSNGDGSDHGWGAHHFAIGGAVQGGVYGSFPQVQFDTNEDIGQGNLLPTTSVDQYAATFARWLGVADASVPDVLPNIGNFGTSRYLDFLV